MTSKRRKTEEGPLRRLGDGEHTLEVIAWAEEQRLPMRRPGPHHLKIGPWNYYPTKRTFNSDNAVKVTARGFDEFKLAVRRWFEEQRTRV